LPQTMLRWHYRSRHHSLIAVSNREFYENKLFIVPSPHLVVAGLGLAFRFVEGGTYDRGQSGTNRVEARLVCRAILDHARKQPGQSLGVAAFSMRQKQAIEDELELLRREQPDLESFFHAHPHEPFFVKNLENVQGDEREVIFISVGYGPDTSGYIAMNFGPLSNEGGERRLNVLISRAKRRCVVFSSLRADDIDLARVTGQGVRCLKAFLQFAETGRLAVAERTVREEDSPFEEAVRRAVESLGYEVHPQVGVAGFFVDFGVLDPAKRGRYLLGIECDGAAYHSSRSARDRDRLRQAVLEDHGWIIQRPPPQNNIRPDKIRDQVPGGANEYGAPIGSSVQVSNFAKSQRRWSKPRSRSPYLKPRPRNQPNRTALTLSATRVETTPSSQRKR
jgi:very-short-patch-repair endonuclease